MSEELTVTQVSAADRADCLELTTRLGWNQLDADWKLFTECGTALAMRCDGRIVGTAAAIGWEKRLAWIGLVLTVPEMRGRSIATTLMKALIERYADHRTIKLDASAMGAPVYRKLGFRDERRIIRLSLKQPLEPAPERLHWEPMTGAVLPEVIKLEAGFTGMARPELYSYYLASYPALAQVGRDATGAVAAWTLGRDGRIFRQAGALGAVDDDAALEAVRPFHAISPGTAIQLDIPEDRTAFLAALAALGFQTERDFLRMALGEDCGDWSDRRTYAVFGPEMG